MYAKAWWFGTKIPIASQRAVLFDNKNISFYICIHDTISFDSPVLRARKKKKREISQVKKNNVWFLWIRRTIPMGQFLF